jgi:hypothetical protein
MNAEQQVIVLAWNAELQRIAAQLQQLLIDATPGCEQLVAQNESDLLPLDNALNAVKKQVGGIALGASRAFDDAYERIHRLGPSERICAEMQRARRDYERWAQQAWMQFASRLFLVQFGAMWPHVQHAMARGASCTRCGAPLSRATPHKNETIACASCHAVNQVAPDDVVASYFRWMPHYCAEASVVERRTAIQKFVDDWEAHQDSERAEGRDRPEEPIERLRERERMEREHWTAYAEARVKLEGGADSDVKALVDTCMRPVLDRLKTKDAWRLANGAPSREQLRAIPPHLKTVDEWGPFDPRSPTAIEDDLVHEAVLFRAESDPARYERTLEALGYRDPLQRAMTHATFRRYFDDRKKNPEEEVRMQMRVGQRASEEEARIEAAEASRNGLMEPIEGISLETYAALESKLAAVGADAFVPVLAQYQLDQSKWERVRRDWFARMKEDPSGAVGSEYYRFYAASPDARPKDVPFERFCELNGAMAAFRKQGKDVAASLQQHFQMSEHDCSNISMHWMKKVVTDPELAGRLGPLIEQFEKSYLAMP